MDVSSSRAVGSAVEDSRVRETFLPYRGFEPKLLTRSECETSLDQLHGFLNAEVIDRKEEMKVIRHYDEFMEEKLLFGSVCVKYLDK